MFQGSDHYAVLMKMKVKDKWMFRKRMNGERKRLRVEKFRDEGIREVYMQRVTEALNAEWENMNGDENAEEVFESYKNVLLKVTENVVGMKVVKLGKKKGNAWWTEEVKQAVSEKREAYKRTLERNVPE